MAGGDGATASVYLTERVDLGEVLGRLGWSERSGRWVAAGRGWEAEVAEAVPVDAGGGR